MRIGGQTNVRADLRQRVAEIGDFLESRMHAVTNVWSSAVTTMTAMTAMPSFTRTSEDRAKTALEGWFGGDDERPHGSSNEMTGNTPATHVLPKSRRWNVRNATISAKSKRTSKEELGTATWTFLHTLAAQYPERPSARQKRDVKALVDIMTRLYPCGECAEHFQEIVRVHPPQVSCQEALSRWMCDVHNAVNRSLDKPVFNCEFVNGRWQGLDGCGRRHGDSGGGCKLRSY